MEGPVDLRMQPYVPARLFTVAEANALLPRLTEIFRRIDPKLARLREIQDLVEDAETYWHSKGEGMPAAERTSYERLVEQEETAKVDLSAEVQTVQALGCELKDMQQGLVDFPGLMEGHLAYLCWQRGEPHVEFWHALEAGFSGRKPLPSDGQAER